MSINRVSISGNLTRDPVLRQTQGGTAVLSFGVAVNDRRRNQQSGEWEDYANFVDCVMFGKRAEAVSRFLAKGTKVAVEGKLSYRSWEAKDGSRRSKLEVNVDEIEFMSRQQPAAQQAPIAYAPQAPAPQAPQAPAQYVPQAPAVPQPQAAPQAPAPQAAAYQQPASQQPAMPDVYDIDIPF